MIRRPPRSTRTDTLFPYTTLFRSHVHEHGPVDLDRLGADQLDDLAVHADADIVRTEGDLLPVLVEDKRAIGADQAPVLVAQEVRSEARRVGKESVSTCSSRWSANH